jgi:hypothetical protein
MTYLHVAVVEDFEECFVSHTSDGLREQVAEFLTANSRIVPTDDEWVVLIMAAEDRELSEAPPFLTPVTYYTTESRLSV